MAFPTVHWEWCRPSFRLVQARKSRRKGHRNFKVGGSILRYAWNWQDHFLAEFVTVTESHNAQTKRNCGSCIRQSVSPPVQSKDAAYRDCRLILFSYEVWYVVSINDTVFNVRHTENTDIAICNTVPKVHFFMQHRNAFEVAMEGRGIDMLLFYCQ